MEVAKLSDLNKVVVLESFEWIPDMKGLKELAKRENGHVYKVEVMHPIITDPLNIGHGPREWTEDELRKSARTMIGKDHICFNHEHIDDEPAGKSKLDGKSIVIDAEFNEKTKCFEAIIFSDSKAVYEEYQKGGLRASLEGRPRQVLTVEGKEVPVGSVFHGMAFVTMDELPGDPDASVELLETNKKRNSSLNEGNTVSKDIMEIKELSSKYLTKEILTKETLEDANAGVALLFDADPELSDEVKQAIMDILASFYQARAEPEQAPTENNTSEVDDAANSAAEIAMGAVEPRMVKKIESVSTEFKGITEKLKAEIKTLQERLAKVEDPRNLREMLAKKPTHLSRSSKNGMRVTIESKGSSSL